jgi:16S rRNA (uracil1498-N3)-methyltransferase
MHRFFLPRSRTSGDLLSLAPDDAHHAIRVLRLGVGDPVVLLDGEGNALRGVVQSAGRREVLVRVMERIRHPAPSTEFILVQAIAKAQAMDGIIHRAVELGCARIQPLLTERSISRPDDLEAKRSRWQDMAMEAAKQSGNPWLTVVSPICTPREWFASSREGMLTIIASLVDPPESLAQILSQEVVRTGMTPRRVAVAIGPEGDFTPEEYAGFRQAGAWPVSLGPLVLRVETAAIALLAMVHYEWNRGKGGSDVSSLGGGR